MAGRREKAKKNNPAMRSPASVDSPDPRQRVKGRKLHADTDAEDLPDYGCLQKSSQKTLKIIEKSGPQSRISQFKV